MCNSSTSPDPVNNCASGFSCLDITQANPSADLGACFRDCDVLATSNTCPANGLGQPEGCSPASQTTTDGLCWPHASPGSAVGATCSLDPDDSPGFDSPVAHHLVYMQFICGCSSMVEF